jgi:glycosyltransferase involved in cell wall biosynthesis
VASRRSARRYWISPHAQALALADSHARPLEWNAAQTRLSRDVGTASTATILFPASALARKGVIELVAALEGIDARVLAPPGAAESPGVWRNLRVETVASIADGLARADLVVLPAWIEHQPRSLLAALSSGIPVIATAACGLPSSSAWRCVPEGDVAALRSAIIEVLVARMRF